LESYSDLRDGLSLLSGFLGVISTIVISLRTTYKYDVKAEMFRGAAGQYRLLATQLEERIRTHRMKIGSGEIKPKVGRFH